MVYKNSDLYEGQWYANTKYEYGTMSVAADGTEYKGNWHNDRKQGDGALMDGTSIIHEGRWIYDEIAENGEYQYPNGDVYTGWHSKGYKHGEGLLVCADREVFEGKWDKDEL